MGLWTYVIAFTDDLEEFIMVRSRKRGGWEMPGGRDIECETMLETSEREFFEETGHVLISSAEWYTRLGEGAVMFGFIGPGDTSRRSTREISEVSLFSELPSDLAYPDEEYRPLISLARRWLSF